MVQLKAKGAPKHAIRIRLTDPSRVRGSAAELLCPSAERDRERQRGESDGCGWVVLDTKSAHAREAWGSEILSAVSGGDIDSDALGR